MFYNEGIAANDEAIPKNEAGEDVVDDNDVTHLNGQDISNKFFCVIITEANVTQVKPDNI